MRNLLQTHSLSWAESVRIALQAEGIDAVILDENAPAYLGFAGRVRVAVVKDAELERARSLVSRLAPPASAPPPSWRLQKRGLRLLALGFALFIVAGVMVDRVGEGLAVYAVIGVAGFAAIAGLVLIAVGPRADRPRSS